MAVNKAALHQSKHWLIAAILVLPALFPFYTHYFIRIDGFIPTGFIQGDQPYYMAAAREHFDNGGFRLTFSNPSSYSYDSPAIYFQPQTLLWGILLRITGWSPGAIFVGTGLIAAIVCMRVALLLYEAVVGLDVWQKWLGAVLFAWGGGLLSFAGIIYNTITHQWQHSIFRFDPFDGWWFLNLGRNLIYPAEAIYHALFLGAVLLMIKSRFYWALAVAFIVSLCHPYTGIELLAIMSAWSFLEVVVWRNRNVPIPFLAGSVFLSLLHVGYYLFFLKLFPEHKLVASQTELDWVLTIKNILPAYALVGGLALCSVLRVGARRFLESSRNRFFLVWFLAAFTLANHELFMRPIQPLHFTRGYIWMPLFLIGAPSLIALFSYLTSQKKSIWKPLAAGALALVFLSDNAIWLGSFPSKGWYGFRLTADEKQLYDWFNSPENKGAIVISKDNQVGYFATVYSPLRAWCSHYSNTPAFKQREAEVKEFYEHGTFLSEWNRLPLLVVSSEKDQVPQASLSATREDISTPFRNNTFTVFRVLPRSDRQ